MVYIYIDGVAMPAPSNYTIKYSDIDGNDDDISEAGYRKRDRIRSNVCTVSCDWVIREEQLKKLCSALSPETFEAKIYNGMTGGYITITAKTSTERTASLSLPNTTNTAKNLWSFSCNIIEL